MKKKLFLLTLSMTIFTAIGNAANCLHALPPTATISYNSPFCNSISTQQPVNMSGTGNFTGGTFSAPSGLDIDATTGSIIPSQSAAGTYTIAYTIPASGPDPEFQATTTILIAAQPYAGIDGSVTICDASLAQINLFALVTGENSGGVWTRVSGTGGMFNAAAGTYTPATGATTSIFIYSVAGVSPCSDDFSAATINVIPQPDAGISGSVTVCDLDATTINLTSVITGELAGGTWIRTSGIGGTFDAANGNFTPAAGTTTSSFQYLVNGSAPCISDASTVTVNMLNASALQQLPDIMSCGSYTLPPLSIGNYYTESGGGGTLIPSGTEINVSTTIYAYAQAGSCSAEGSFQIIIISVPIIPQFSLMTDFCAGSVAPLLPVVSDNGVSGFWTPPMIDTSISGHFLYQFTPQFSQCSQSVTLEISVVDCTGITLSPFLDINGNAVRDNGEPNFPLGQFTYEVNNDGITHNVTSMNGSYIIRDQSASSSYDITYNVSAPFDASYNVTTTSINGVSPAANYPQYDFPVTILNQYADLNATLIPNGSPILNSQYVNTIVYTNNGNILIPGGTITFNNDPALTISQISQSGTVSMATGFTYDFPSLAPFETRSIIVTMVVPNIPDVSIGQLITDGVSISNSDSTLTDTSSVTQSIGGSYDPNDKTESHGKDIVFSSFTSEDYLYYTIRFENTGNASAINVKITDALDAKLDENSVIALNGYRPFSMERISNELDFLFNNIYLPPVTIDPIGAKGYVMFKVKPKPGFEIGDIVPNTASIYFDSNPAIITNTFNTRFVQQLETAEFANNSFTLFPNPATDELTIEVSWPSTISAIAIFDILGKKVLIKLVNGYNIQTLDLKPLGAGMYFVEVETSDGLKSIKKLMVK